METLLFFSRNTFVTLQLNCLTITCVILPWKCFWTMSNPSATKAERFGDSPKHYLRPSSPRSSSMFINGWSHDSLSTLCWHCATRIETPIERWNPFSMNTTCTHWMINRNWRRSAETFSKTTPSKKIDIRATRKKPWNTYIRLFVRSIMDAYMMI